MAGCVKLMLLSLPLADLGLSEIILLFTSEQRLCDEKSNPISLIIILLATQKK